MKISVVMAAFNRERELPAAVASVTGQAHRDLELIVVDDGSADQTAALVRKVASGDPRVQLISFPENRGASAARNAGIAAATGDAIIVWDSDDLLYPEALGKMAAVLEARPEVAIVSAPARFVRGGVPEAGQQPGESMDVPPAAVMCKTLVGSREKLRLARSAGMKRMAYGPAHLDFLVSVGLTECGAWHRIGEFLGDVEVGQRPGSLTAKRKAKIPEASAARAAVLRPFLDRHAATMRGTCPARLAAYEWAAAWGSLLGGAKPEARRFSRSAVGDDPCSLRAWMVLVACHIPGSAWLARTLWGTPRS